MKVTNSISFNKLLVNNAIIKPDNTMPKNEQLTNLTKQYDEHVSFISKHEVP